MIHKHIYTATEAREKLFEILNLVYYGNSDVIIMKNKKPMVRIVKEKNLPDKNSVFSLAGAMKVEDADRMEKTVQSLKKVPARKP